MKKIIAFLLTVTVIAASLCACAPAYSDPTEKIKVNKSTDKYRNFYEIFVGSFNDSNGDGIGDLKGIIQKLDYLNDGNAKTDTDLGIDGIWLTPVMPSHSYHKYDVKDYFNIDESFGTLEDFDKLVSECHKRGIKLIIDMVLNHSSKFNPLFESACAQALKGDLKHDAKYYEIERYDINPGDAYTELGKGYYYESNFSPYMPEWNLFEDCTRDYFKKISSFWLKDHNVDGFRLDATKYYTCNHGDGKDFLKWYCEACRKIKPDVYIVGENWTGNAEINEMYLSKADSFFAFGFADAAGGFVNAVRNQSSTGLISSVKRFEDKSKENNENRINAYFLSNHDQTRSANYLKSAGLKGMKMAAALYMLMPGNPFIYYGEEIGLSQQSSAEGDEYKREPMIWDKDNLPDIVVNQKTSAEESQAKFGGVKQQEKDKFSLMNFYKRIIKIKNQNPEIARGTISEYGIDDTEIAAYSVEYNGSKVYVIHNLNNSKSKEIELKDNLNLRGDLNASNDKDTEEHITLNGKTLTLPPFSTAILK